MDPKRVAEIRKAMAKAVNDLNNEYAMILHRCGVRHIVVYMI